MADNRKIYDTCIILTIKEYQRFFRTVVTYSDHIRHGLPLEPLLGVIKESYDPGLDALASKYIEDQGLQIKRLIDLGKRDALLERTSGASVGKIRSTGTPEEIEDAESKWRDYLEFIIPLHRDDHTYAGYIAINAHLAGDHTPPGKKDLDTCLKMTIEATHKIMEVSGAKPEEVWGTASGYLYGAVSTVYSYYHTAEYNKHMEWLTKPSEEKGMTLSESAWDLNYAIKSYHERLEKWANIEKLANKLALVLGLPPVVESKTKTPKQPRARKGAIPGQLTIWESWETMGYLPMLQSPGYNTLIHTMGAKPDRVDMLGKRIIERNKMTVSITGLPDSIKKLPTSAAKLLDMFQIKAAQGGMSSGRVVTLPLNEYMEIRGLRDKKEAREQVKRDLELLQRVDVKYTDKRHNYLAVSLSGGTRAISNGVIGFKFNEDWLELFPLKNQIMPMPKGLFATNDNANPHAYYFGRAISVHRRMNGGKCNECTISVKTLVKASPTFPTYESIGDAKQIEKRIIGPFERDLEAAAQATGGKFYWNYAGVNTEDPPATYADFIDAKIFITWNEYPDTDTIKRGRKHYKKMASKGKLKGKKASG